MASIWSDSERRWLERNRGLFKEGVPLKEVVKAISDDYVYGLDKLAMIFIIATKLFPKEVNFFVNWYGVRVNVADISIISYEFEWEGHPPEEWWDSCPHNYSRFKDRVLSLLEKFMSRSPFYSDWAGSKKKFIMNELRKLPLELTGTRDRIYP